MAGGPSAWADESVGSAPSTERTNARRRSAEGGGGAEAPAAATPEKASKHTKKSKGKNKPMEVEQPNFAAVGGEVAAW